MELAAREDPKLKNGLNERSSWELYRSMMCSSPDEKGPRNNKDSLGSEMMPGAIEFKKFTF